MFVKLFYVGHGVDPIIKLAECFSGRSEVPSGWSAIRKLCSRSSIGDESRYHSLNRSVSLSSADRRKRLKFDPPLGPLLPQCWGRYQSNVAQPGDSIQTTRMELHDTLRNFTFWAIAGTVLGLVVIAASCFGIPRRSNNRLTRPGSRSH